MWVQNAPQAHFEPTFSPIIEMIRTNFKMSHFVLGVQMVPMKVIKFKAGSQKHTLWGAKPHEGGVS
jgi:hypothetical protein